MHHYKIQFLNYKHDLTTVISCITKLMVTVVSLHFSDIKRMTVMKCDLCGSVTPAVRCGQCENNIFCASCDDRYHRHPKRQTHIRTVSFCFLHLVFLRSIHYACPFNQPSNHSNGSRTSCCVRLASHKFGKSYCNNIHPIGYIE